MFASIVILAALANALRPGRRDIINRPYNNRYNPASGARDNGLG
jgi:hypothetical protein